MMPSSEATLSQLAVPPALRKLMPPNTEKKAVTQTRPMSEPISGRRMRLPNVGAEGRTDCGCATAAWPCERVAVFMNGVPWRWPDTSCRGAFHAGRRGLGGYLSQHDTAPGQVGCF